MHGGGKSRVLPPPLRISFWKGLRSFGFFDCFSRRVFGFGNVQLQLRSCHSCLRFRGSRDYRTSPPPTKRMHGPWDNQSVRTEHNQRLYRRNQFSDSPQQLHSPSPPSAGIILPRYPHTHWKNKPRGYFGHFTTSPHSQPPQTPQRSTEIRKS